MPVRAVYPDLSTRTMNLTTEYVNKLLGVQLPGPQIAELLTKMQVGRGGRAAAGSFGHCACTLSRVSRVSRVPHPWCITAAPMPACQPLGFLHCFASGAARSQTAV